MAGNRSVACAEGRLSLVRVRERRSIDFNTPLIAPSPHPDALPIWQRDRRESAQAPERFQSDLTRQQTPYPVAGMVQNHFKLCDFALVTPTSLLY
jgi:hypothetical protein